jgi:hypothetical protein
MRKRFSIILFVFITLLFFFLYLFLFHNIFFINSLIYLLEFNERLKPNPTNELQEILSLSWGNKEGQVGYNTEYDLAKISNSIGSHYGPPFFIVDEYENIYIFDYFNNRILKFKDKALLHTFNFSKLSDDINIDNSENLYIHENNLIIKYNKQGTIIDNITIPDDLKIDSWKIDNSQNIYFLCEKNFIVKYNKDNKSFQKYPVQKEIFYWDIDKHGFIYFLSNMQDTYIINCLQNSKISEKFIFNDKIRHYTFLGIDENTNFYFYKSIIKTYKVSEKDKVNGLIIHIADVIVANQGVVLYKYNSKGQIIKEFTLNDPTLYSIKINIKGNFYLTPRLETLGLLRLNLNKYRIYKYCF